MNQHMHDLARAVRAGNLQEAELVLDLISRDRGGGSAEGIARGRAAADKAAGRIQALPAAAPLTLPLPGAAPGAALGDDPSERVGFPRYRRAA